MYARGLYNIFLVSCIELIAIDLKGCRIFLYAEHGKTNLIVLNLN